MMGRDSLTKGINGKKRFARGWRGFTLRTPRQAGVGGFRDNYVEIRLVKGEPRGAGVWRGGSRGTLDKERVRLKVILWEQRRFFIGKAAKTPHPEQNPATPSLV